MDKELNLQNLMKRNYLEIKTRNSRFSIRSFARQLGIQPSATNEIMNGQRKVSRAFAEKLIAKLKVSSEERESVLRSFTEQQNYHSQSFSLNDETLGQALEILRNARSEIEKISATENPRNIEVTVIISAAGHGSVIC